MQKQSSNGLWIIIALTVFVLLIGAGLMFSSSPSPATNSQNQAVSGALSAEASFYDFGTISMKDGDVSKAFPISNSSESPVTIAKLYTSCMCTKAKLKTPEREFGPYGMAGHGIIPRIDASLEGGQQAEVEVVFDPAAHGPAGIGPISREVYVETTDGKKLTLSFKANVTP
ncbi:MAG: hypothetical protein COT92_00310 [Candidatus Doudnabacteria bacterium CG10_big_fil_rev_8_21_14_0_10_42_18]|uniref:DUF1573 domain-containing protein n=1 Tax=Candidatus Doudnabacteria bacterium CG10_big_fil_rev_8_21_14_0_10_42_18 TaxID=1974552 RepID=A0A2H0VBV6_9BACT|nr:MAG: hypothetical protein COT92_00310 [Candidatus Doudnabacteria bacterium CG10_big_fil_rev_8_21_14_0_10_42_18]